MEILLPTGRICASRLNAATPAGLFLPTHTDSASLFWIVEEEGRRVAIVLKARDERFLFDTLPLSDETSNWTGYSIGPAELLVDASAGEFQEVHRPVLGCISLGQGVATLGVRSNRGFGFAGQIVGQSAPTESRAGVVFPCWQLVQRDHLGAPIVRFEAGKLGQQ